jgi:glycogen debranching enzyme
MPIAFDRSVCCDLNETISREWLITNGLGGYAAGTVAGVLTRMQHGLLVAPVDNRAPPQLLLAKIDEEAVFDQRIYYLGTNEYRDGTLSPAGFLYLESFRLEEGFPIFTYRIGGIDGVMLEKRIWMAPGQHTTYIQYRIWRTTERQEEPPGGPREGESSRGAAGLRRAASYRTYMRYPPFEEHRLEIALLPLTAYRPFDRPQSGHNDWHFQVEVHHSSDRALNAGASPWPASLLALPRGVTGCTLRAQEGASPYHLFVVGHPESQPIFIPTGVWYWHFLRRLDQQAGRPAVDDLYLPGVFRARLWPGEEATLTVIATTEDPARLTLTPGYIALAYQRSLEYQRSLLQPQRYFGEGGETSYRLHALSLLPPDGTVDPQDHGEDLLRLLVQAGDHFLVRHPPARPEGGDYYLTPFEMQETGTSSIISSFYELEEYTRDALIALPGLVLATGRLQEGRRLLRSLARCFRQGLLPDRLPCLGQRLSEEDYGSVDTTLWYFYALDHYLRFSGDKELLLELYQRLAESLVWYLQGTWHGIQMDPADGLLRGGAPGRALTWMNACVAGTPVTPRMGKPVEVNALWYHALALMEEWGQLLREHGRDPYLSGRFQELRQRCQESFQRFWYAEGGYLYDVIDGPTGADAMLRPNQVLALSLRHVALAPSYREAALEQVSRHLLTPYGLRTLAPSDPAYRGQLGSSFEEQQQALHQGSVWSWLIGPYVDALLNLQGASTASASEGSQASALGQEYIWRKSLQMLEPFWQDCRNNLLAQIGGVFEGDPPHRARYQAASASGVGEILRIYSYLAQIGVGHQAPALSV